MPTYSYIAIDPRGARVWGTMEATDPDAIVSSLTAQGLRIETVEAQRKAGEAVVEGNERPRLSAGEAREISGHIAEVVSAGMPLEGALAAIAEELPFGRLRRGLRRIVGRLDTGADLENALASAGAPRYLPALVRAGARSGRTGEILESFIAGSRAVSELRHMLWMALAYPLVLAFLLSGLAVFLISWIVPQFASMFDTFGTNVPWITSALILASRSLVDHGLQVFPALVAALVVVGLVLRTALGQAQTRRMLCLVPVFGPLSRWLAMARFSTLLSLLVEGRVPLDEALILAGEASGDAEIRADCLVLQASVRTGKTLEQALRERKRFPSSFVRALAMNPHRDGFPEVLHSMADMYAGRARALVTILMTLLPPLVVALVGLIVGFVVVALFMPLFQMLRVLSI
jgi:type II secretory pathway component PulF